MANPQFGLGYAYNSEAKNVFFIAVGFSQRFIRQLKKMALAKIFFNGAKALFKSPLSRPSAKADGNEKVSFYISLTAIGRTLAKQENQLLWQQEFRSFRNFGTLFNRFNPSPILAANTKPVTELYITISPPVYNLFITIPYLVVYFLYFCTL